MAPGDRPRLAGRRAAAFGPAGRAPGKAVELWRPRALPASPRLLCRVRSSSGPGSLTLVLSQASVWDLFAPVLVRKPGRGWAEPGARPAPRVLLGRTWGGGHVGRGSAS